MHEGPASDVPGVRPQDVGLHAAVDGQGGDEGLVGGAALKATVPVETRADPRPLGPGSAAAAPPAHPGRGTPAAAARLGPGAGEHLLHRALLRHAAVVQDGHPVADLLNDLHVVGDDHHCDAQALVDVPDKAEDVTGGLGVQGGGGLVAQQDLGIGGQGPGDGHPLLLSPGELGG